MFIANELIDFRAKLGIPGGCLQVGHCKGLWPCQLGVFDWRVVFWAEVDHMDSWVHLFGILYILFEFSPPDFSKASRGLCQGDLISPLLFLLVIEVFTRILSLATSAGISIGWRNSTTISVSHLLVTDDPFSLSRWWIFGAFLFGLRQCWVWEWTWQKALICRWPGR